uniref:Uncharacterized protein n=1 Tax=Arcella intermedia TaxID=1963864 RepID=A0A6B2LHV9_9EUKA
MEANTTLKQINLAGNNIGDEEVIKIAEALEINKSLDTIYLASNQISNGGIVRLAKCLSKNTTLTALNIANNPFHEEITIAFLPPLETNTSIISLGPLHRKRNDNMTFEFLMSYLKVNYKRRLELACLLRWPLAHDNLPEKRQVWIENLLLGVRYGRHVPREVVTLLIQVVLEIRLHLFTLQKKRTLRLQQGYPTIQTIPTELHAYFTSKNN